MPQAPAKKSIDRVKKSTTIFSSEYTKLNPAQKRAVDTIEGPIMVVAGPGTGKTQVVAMRVANILKKTHMRPGNILCLTFSISGATAMRERLRLLVGADAYGVRVSTIHAFAQSVIEENPMLFEEFSAREQISDLQRAKEMNTIIDQFLPHSIVLNPKDPYAKSSALLSRISQVKREGKSHEDLLATANLYDKEMAGKSKPGTKVHERNLQSAKKFRDFIDMFKRYQEMLAATGRYDYDDMILHAIRALEEEDWLRATLQERFQYVLVDEFQDTNGAQAKLIELLTTFKDLPNEPNIFVVGDDDQAIYRFQGANLQNMLGFHRRFPKAPVIALTESYRSTQPILDAARSLIERNQERLVGKIPGLEKILTAASHGDAALRRMNSPPTLLRAASDTAEPWLIADLAEERLRAGIPLEEIAILTRTNRELLDLHDVLRARGIPVLLHGKDDLLFHPLVLQAVTILRGVAQPRSDARLSAALGCACFGVHPAQLGRLHALARENDQRLVDAQVEDLRLVHARDTILDLHHKLPSRTMLETVEIVLRMLIPETRDASDPRDFAALEAFFSFVKQRSFDDRSLSLQDLLSDLDFYTDPMQADVRLTYTLLHLELSGVRLMTAHQSKGLEFHTVILSNFREGHWDKRRKFEAVSLPENLLFGWIKEEKTAEEQEDERRLAYVAATRAKREVIMICPRELTIGEKTRAVSPSGFFAEMTSASEEEGHLRDPEKASVLLHPKARPLDDALKGYLTERLKTFALSPTSLNRFLKDPQEFLLVDLLQQPEHFDEGSMRALGYGSAVHWALRSWAIARKEKKPFEVAHFVEAFGWYLRERTILTETQREHLLVLGREALPRYFEAKLASTSPVLHTIEREYRMHLGDIPIKGKIDRIDLLSESSSIATVIDYKTGRAKSDAEIRGGLERGILSKTDEGSLFRQLVFYAVVLEHADPLLQPEAFVLEFIGERGEDPVSRSFPVTHDEKKQVRSMVADVWNKIIKFDFSPL